MFLDLTLENVENVEIRVLLQREVGVLVRDEDVVDRVGNHNSHHRRRRSRYEGFQQRELLPAFCPIPLNVFINGKLDWRIYHRNYHVEIAGLVKAHSALRADDPLDAVKSTFVVVIALGRLDSSAHSFDRYLQEETGTLGDQRGGGGDPTGVLLPAWVKQAVHAVVDKEVGVKGRYCFPKHGTDAAEVAADALSLVQSGDGFPGLPRACARFNDRDDCIDGVNDGGSNVGGETGYERRFEESVRILVLYFQRRVFTHILSFFNFNVND